MTSEFDLISTLFAPWAKTAESLALADDAAVIVPPAGQDIVISVDALVRGIHFEEDASAELVARRLVGSAVSDLIAKGSTPWGCLLTFGRSPDWDVAWCSRFASEFGAAIETYEMALWGGDTVSGSGFVSLVVHGLVPQGQMIARHGARQGDDVYVTGTIGDGYLGRILPDLAPDDPVRRAYCAPQPPREFAQKLAKWAHASIDISDGLAADLDHMALASGCVIEIRLSDIPISKQGRRYVETHGWEALVSGGDDYQTVFTASAEHRALIEETARQAQLSLHRIGRVSEAGAAKPETVFLNDEGQSIRFLRRGFDHFE